MNNNELKIHLFFFKQYIVDLNNPDIYSKIDEHFDRTVFLKNMDFLENNSFIVEDDRNSIYSITKKGEKKLAEIIKELEYNSEKEKIEFENLKSNTAVNKWLLKTKWYPLVISIIAILASIFLGLKDSSKNNELEERILNLEKSESIKNDAKPIKNYPKKAVEKVTSKKLDTLKKNFTIK